MTRLSVGPVFQYDRLSVGPVVLFDLLNLSFLSFLPVFLLDQHSCLTSLLTTHTLDRLPLFARFLFDRRGPQGGESLTQGAVLEIE